MNLETSANSSVKRVRSTGRLDETKLQNTYHRIRMIKVRLPHVSFISDENKVLKNSDPETQLDFVIDGIKRLREENKTLPIDIFFQLGTDPYPFEEFKKYGPIRYHVDVTSVSDLSLLKGLSVMALTVKQWLPPRDFNMEFLELLREGIYETLQCLRVPAFVLTLETAQMISKFCKLALFEYDMIDPRFSMNILPTVRNSFMDSDDKLPLLNGEDILANNHGIVDVMIALKAISCYTQRVVIRNHMRAQNYGDPLIIAKWLIDNCNHLFSVYFDYEFLTFLEYHELNCLMVASFEVGDPVHIQVNRSFGLKDFHQHFDDSIGASNSLTINSLQYNVDAGFENKLFEGRKVYKTVYHCDLPVGQSKCIGCIIYDTLLRDAYSEFDKNSTKIKTYYGHVCSEDNNEFFPLGLLIDTFALSEF